MRINFRRCKGRKCRTDLWNDKPLPAPETKDGQNFMREHHLYNRLFPSYMSPPSIHHTPLSLSPAATTTAVPTLRIDKLRIGQPLCVTVSPHPLTALTDQLRVSFLLFTLLQRNHLIYTQHFYFTWTPLLWQYENYTTIGPTDLEAFVCPSHLPLSLYMSSYPGFSLGKQCREQASTLFTKHIFFY